MHAAIPSGLLPQPGIIPDFWPGKKIMPAARSCSLPTDALLRKYVDSGDYTDCFCIEIDPPITQTQFVTAFYTTWIFKLERLILKLFLGKASSDADVSRLADAAADSFAAWIVEERNSNQLLLTDYAGQTRSWLMTSPPEAAQAGRTRLYFGSAIVRRKDETSGKKSMGFAFRLLLGFHKIYSRVLLQAAKSRLQR